MTQLVFFLEEPSAKEMLKGLLPRMLPHEIQVRYVVFDGKQDLEKRLPIRLRAWLNPCSLFVVLRDQDSGNCMAIKQRLAAICEKTDKGGVLIRIACRELESWYLGDLAAVANAIGPTIIRSLQKKRKFRNPDRLANPKQELKKIAPDYQQISGSRAIGPHLSLTNNVSTSFNVFVSGIRRLTERDPSV